MREDLWWSVGILVYLAVTVSLLLGMFVSGWVAAIHALVVSLLGTFAWLTK